LKPSANVKRFKKVLNLREIVRVAIGVADSYCKVKDIVHHARLKDILEKLIVVYSPTRLDF
jgi:hypothetical protein